MRGRPAFPWASPWARRAGDVAPYHGCVGWGVVGADVPGGPPPAQMPYKVPGKESERLDEMQQNTVVLFVCLRKPPRMVTDGIGFRAD